MAKRKPVRRYKTGSQVSAEKAQSAIDAKNEAASKAASDQSSGGSRSNPTKQGSTISSSASARAIAEKKAASDQSGRSSAASVAAPSGGRAESRAAQAPQAKAGSQVDDSVAQAAIAAKGLPGITEASGRGRAPSPQAGGQLARDALMGKRTYEQSIPSYGGVFPPNLSLTAPETGAFLVPGVDMQFSPEFAGMGYGPNPTPSQIAEAYQYGGPSMGVYGQPASTYDPQRMMEINQTPGIGLPFMDPTLFADASVDVLANPTNRGIRADLARVQLGLESAPQPTPPAVTDAQTAEWETAALNDRIAQALPDLAPTTSMRPTMAPQTTSMTTRPQMRPELMDYSGNVIPGGYAELRTTGVAPNRSLTTTSQFPVGQPVSDPYTMPPAPMTFDMAQDPFEEGFRNALGPQASPFPQPRPERDASTASPNFTSEPVSLTNMRPIMNPSYGPNTPREEFFSPPAPAPAPAPTAPQMRPVPRPGFSGVGGPDVQPTTDLAAPQRAAPPAGVTPQQIAADTAQTAGFRTPAANVARIPGIGPTVAGVMDRVGSAFGDGDGPFGLPANERTTIDDFTESQREMDRGSDRERGSSSGGIPFPGKGGGGGYRPGQQQPDNPPYIPPIGPPGYSTAPTTITPTPAYQSFGDLNAAAAQGFAGVPDPYTVSPPTTWADVPVPAPYVPPPPVTGPGQPAPPSTPSTGSSFLDRLFGLFRGTSGMAQGGMVQPGMTNAFTPGSYYASYDPRRRGLGGM